MAEFMNIDYRKINEAVPGIHAPMYVPATPPPEKLKEIQLEGRTFHISDDTFVIYNTLMEIYKLINDNIPKKKGIK